MTSFKRQGVQGVGFRLERLGWAVWDRTFRVRGLSLKGLSLRFRTKNLGFRVEARPTSSCNPGLVFRVQGLGFSV